MLYFIFVWTFLTLISFLIGTGILNTFKADGFERKGDRFIVAVWLGVVVLSISLLAASLVFPLSPLVGVIIAASLVSLSLLLQKTRSEIVALWSIISPSLIWGFLTLEILVAALTAKQVTWLDTGLYHYGAIRWLSEYGAVPGVALILNQLGFTSSWFALAAPLNPQFFGDRVTAATNGFVFIIAVLHFLICLVHCFTNKKELSDWFVVIFSTIILPFSVASSLMSVILVSPSPDFPVIFLTEVVAWTILIVANQKSSYLPESNFSILTTQALPLILSAGAVSIKLSALPILFISSLFYLFYSRFNLRQCLMGSAITLLLLLPMFISGIITSGCPLYPSSFLCVDLPWTPTPQAVKLLIEDTRGWGSWFGSPPPGSIPILWLFWQWFGASVLNKAIIFLIVISTLLTIYVVRALMTSRMRGQFWILALAVLGTTFMMLKAPVIRFGLGYLILIPALSIAVFCQTKLDKVLPPLAQKLTSHNLFSNFRKLGIVVPLFLATLIFVSSGKNSAESRLLLPPPLQKVEVLQKQVNDVKYFSPKYSRELCWSAKLPCTPFEVKNDIRLREPSRGIRAGFIYKRAS
ncbi:MAG: hypothetical protein M3O33_22425 [Cyanobacteriota bacterium]|nr:hypothetical protein [Cyanobacteriota bacterium]